MYFVVIYVTFLLRMLRNEHFEEEDILVKFRNELRPQKFYESIHWNVDSDHCCYQKVH